MTDSAGSIARELLGRAEEQMEVASLLNGAFTRAVHRHED
jgi:hypothetical protein